MNALEQAVIDAAIAAYGTDARWCGPEEQALELAVSALLAERERIAAKPCVCRPGEELACLSAECRVDRERREREERVWVERAWADVREGDVIRPPGNNDARAIVVKRGPVNHWHVAPNANQYRPHESAMEWSSIDVTMLPVGQDGKADMGACTHTPANGMKPDAAVEIQVTRAELAAIEACGGWNERVGVTYDGGRI